MLDISIVSGPVRLILFVLGPLALTWLVLRRRPGWWRRRVPVALAAGVAAAGLLVLLVQVIWKPFPDPLPRPAILYTGLFVTAIVLAVRRGGSKWTAAFATLSVFLVALTGAAQVNQQFEGYRTPRAVLGLPLEGQISYADVPKTAETIVKAAPGQPLSATWRAPAGLSPNGVVTTVDIPGATSGFPARQALIYLPPAYQSTPRALLPVVVLIAGQPGSPVDWFNGAPLTPIMDSYASAHDGLAPIVVVPDALGSQLANPLCVDSPAGNAFTYLSVDVPAWIDANLQVDPDRRKWAVGGISFGGTCAVQLAVGKPDTFATAIVLSGQQAPTLGSLASTLKDRFGGSQAAYQAANPVDVLARRQFPGSAAVVGVGTQDTSYGPQAKVLSDALRAGGFQVRDATAPGAHSWVVWGAIFTQELPWLGTRLGLTAG